MALTTIGSIAGHIARSFILPEGISGNLIETVDTARIDVQNYTGESIGSNSINETYQSAITNFAKAQAIEEAFAWANTYASSGTAMVGGGAENSQEIKLADLSVSDSDSSGEAKAMTALSSLSRETPKQLRDIATESLKSIGRKIRFSRSVS